MAGNVALFEGRNVARFVLVGLVGVWLSGCSSDAGRFADSGRDPFSNPFGVAANAPTSTPSVSSQPLPGNVETAYAVPASPSPYRAGSPPAPAPVSTGSVQPPRPEMVGGSSAGWSAVGGTPVVVGEADTLDTLSRRYGVPGQALLGANGLKAPSQVHPGMHLVVPVYSARNSQSVQPIPNASEPKKRHGLESARADEPTDAEAERALKAKAKAKKAAADAEEADAPVKPKAKKLASVDDAADAPSKKVKDKAKEKADNAKPTIKEPPKREAKTQDKSAALDKTPTGHATANESDASVETSQEADAKGAAPEFRWPARGRIILGFKDSGNDGINISVPEGTSVRAAEAGTVAYAGNALKGYGNLVLIKHPNGFVTAYANNGDLNVKRGDTVKRGQVIAKSGESGNVTSPQLHFELRNKAGAPVDPTGYLAGL